MVTLNFAMITMMIGASMMPMHTENMHAPITYPTAQTEIVHRDSISAPAAAKEVTANSINKDKTYEQCMKEAFEKIYEEVNRLLDQIPDQADEQFQLHRMM